MKNLINKMFIIEGILLATLGALLIIEPIATLTVTASIILGVVGVLQIARGFNNKYKKYYILNGLVNILFGLVLGLYPISAISTLVLIYGVLTLIKGLYLIIVNNKLKTDQLNISPLWYVVIMVLGAVLVINPISLVSSIPCIIGLYFITTAILDVYLGYKLL